MGDSARRTSVTPRKQSFAPHRIVVGEWTGPIKERYWIAICVEDGRVPLNVIEYFKRLGRHTHVERLQLYTYIRYENEAIAKQALRYDGTHLLDKLVKVEAVSRTGVKEVELSPIRLLTKFYNFLIDW